MTDSDRKVKTALTLVRAATIGAKNSVEMTGAPWRHWRDHAPELGVKLRKVGRKQFILLDELLAALSRSEAELPLLAESANDIIPNEPSDAAAHVRALLGKRLRGGSR